MSPTTALVHRVRRGSLVLTLGFVVAAIGPSEAVGQVPAVKTDIQGLEAFQCSVLGVPDPASAEESAQAVQLGSTASQAVVLGDLARARELLARAVSLDPGSAGLAYQFGRVLEDLGETRDAVLQYCRALAFGAAGEEALDARSRVDAYANATRRRIASEAIQAFADGVAAAGLRRWGDALAAFEAAAAAHADFPEAHYNQGVALEALGRELEAAEAYRRYLDMGPDPADAIQVSERIGQLQVVPASSASAGSALALGMLLPGGGQFYTGRPLGGVALLALAGGAAAAGFLIEETDIRCLNAVEPGQACPPAQIIGRNTTRPYLTYGLAGAGALMLAGALEAFFHARGLDEVEVASFGDRSRLLGPSVRARGLRADVRFFRVTF
ncbi:MAG: tetratricopeptide repeat protein [Gemmatimonadetes bacterium]|nr:tetratricopeptide repeat protein [Gemmatimonadota bacterium]